MPEDRTTLNIKLFGDDFKYWRDIREKIGATTDVSVFFFMYKQFRELIGEEFKLLDLKEVRKVYDARKEWEDKIKKYELEIENLKKENEVLNRLLKEKP